MTGNGAGPPAMAQNGADPHGAGPPWRVGRLAQTVGGVSTHGADATSWTVATPNAPLSSGDALWTQPSSGAVMEVSDSRIALDGVTELDLATLDNHQLVATEPQGRLFLDLRDVPPGDGYSITTPRGVVQLSGTGQYEIAAGDTLHDRLRVARPLRQLGAEPGLRPGLVSPRRRRLGAVP